MYLIKKITCKLLQKHRLFVYAHENFSTKSTTHYDTLKLSPNATHGEIKSAFYKLSLQYHPDRNKSEQAKKIFQKVSEAYDVLGNHKSRKQYDRFINVRSDNIPKSMSHSDVNENVTYSRQTKIYDFEEWTREHYSTVFAQNIERKKRYNQYKEMKKEPEKTIYDSVAPMIGVLLILVYLAFEINLAMKDNDEPLDKRNK